MIRNHFKTAWRSIARNKIYTFINVLGLSVGICACLIIYAITSYELRYDNFHPDRDRIYRVVRILRDPQGKEEYLGYTISALPLTLRSSLSGLESAAAFYNYRAKVKIPGVNNESREFDAPAEAEGASAVIITEPQYFRLFKYQWLAGNASTALNEPFKVVLSENEAQRYFGTLSPENVIGKDVIYNDSLHVTVSGIVKDWNKNTDFGFKDFISFNTVRHSFLKNTINLNNWAMWDINSQGFVKLANGVSPAQIERQFPQFIKDHHILIRPGCKIQLKLQPLSDIHFNSAYEDAYSRKAHLPALYGLMAIAAFILIIATINFINLSTAQALGRIKEVGIRKVLGSSKANLATQFLTETFLVVIVAVVIAVIITNPVISFFYWMMPGGVVFNFFSPSALIFLFLLTVITSLLSGFYPAKVLSSYLPVLSLKGRGLQKITRKAYLGKILIVFQFAVSLVFIISTLVIGNQIHFMMNKNLGFNKDAIVTFRTGLNNPVNKTDVFANKIKQIVGVNLVSEHYETPAAKMHPGTAIAYKGAGGVSIDAYFDMCDENYVPLFGLNIIAGRNILTSDTLRELLVNETCARQLGFLKPANAIGKTVETGVNNKNGIIVGVLKDFHSESFRSHISPFFMGSVKNNERSVSVKLGTKGQDLEHFEKTLLLIEHTWKEIYPNEKFEYAFFDETISRLYDSEQKTVQLMSAAMAIAIFISCSGLFALATFTAKQRIKEIGIRKVLGASTPGIAVMLSKDFLSLIVIALLIASPAAYYFMHLWLQDFAYRITISWWMFLLSGLSAILIALITISFQSVKAALTNPVKSLRSE